MNANSQNYSLRLAQRFRAVTLDGKWVANTNFRELLETISWREAIYKIDSLNTIAALTFHVNYYIEGTLPVFEGADLTIRDKFSFELPEMQKEDDWHRIRTRLLSNAEVYAASIERLSNEDLQADFADPKYGTYQRNIEGLIEHCYYHLGQAVLLAKLISEKLRGNE